MNKFELESNYNPSGDQPNAIKELVEGIKTGDKFPPGYIKYGFHDQASVYIN